MPSITNHIALLIEGKDVIMVSIKSLLVEQVKRAKGKTTTGFRRSTNLDGKVYVLDFTASRSNAGSYDYSMGETQKAVGYRNF